jgi:hypothetical protein
MPVIYVALTAYLLNCIFKCFSSLSVSVLNLLGILRLNSYYNIMVHLNTATMVLHPE